MNRVRAVFLEPLWGILFALLPWVLLLPLLMRDTADSELIIKSFGLKILMKNHLNYIFSASFLSLLGIVLVRLINELNLLIKENYLIGFVISVLGSLILNYDPFTVSCLASLVYTFGLFWLCKSPKEGNLNKYVFNAGFFFFLSVFIDSKFLIIAPLSFLFLLFLRTFSIRVVLVFISALIVITAVLQQLNYLLTDRFMGLNDFFFIHEPVAKGLTEHQSFVLIGLFIFQLIIALGSFPNLYMSLSNKLKSVNRILFYGLIVLTTLLLVERFSIERFQNTIYLLSATSVLITVNFMFIRNKWLMRINVIGFLLSVILFFL